MTDDRTDSTRFPGEDESAALVDAHRAYLATALGVIAFVAAVVSFIL